MSIRHVILGMALCGSLAACGDTLGQQGLGGAAVGAGVAAVTSGSLVQGAVIGAGANIAYCQLNPGKCRGY
jgi:osmotically inducible lipoprotein OsmB